MATVDSMAESFITDLTTSINMFFPTKSVRIHHTEKPWITSSIKQLILDTQRAYHSVSPAQWKVRNDKVRDAICKRKVFYQEKVQHLRTSDPRKWWSTINKIYGKSNNNTLMSFEDETAGPYEGFFCLWRQAPHTPHRGLPYTES